jgi:hypothetical protein
VVACSSPSAAPKTRRPFHAHSPGRSSYRRCARGGSPPSTLRAGRPSWFEMASTLSDDSAPSASLGQLEARAAPTHPRAPPEHLGSLPWPQEPATGRTKVEDSPLSTTRRPSRSRARTCCAPSCSPRLRSAPRRRRSSRTCGWRAAPRRSSSCSTPSRGSGTCGCAGCRRSCCRCASPPATPPAHPAAPAPLLHRLHLLHLVVRLHLHRRRRYAHHPHPHPRHRCAPAAADDGDAAAQGPTRRDDQALRAARRRQDGLRAPARGRAGAPPPPISPPPRDDLARREVAQVLRQQEKQGSDYARHAS